MSSSVTERRPSPSRLRSFPGLDWSFSKLAMPRMRSSEVQSETRSFTGPEPCTCSVTRPEPFWFAPSSTLSAVV